MCIQGIEAVVGSPVKYIITRRDQQPVSDDVLPRHRKSSATTPSSTSAAANDQASEMIFQLPLNTVPEHQQHLTVSSPATRVVRQGTDQGGGIATTVMNMAAEQRTGCTSSTMSSACSNSDLSSPTTVVSQSSVTPMSQLLVSGTSSSSSSLSPFESSLGRGSMTLGPDDFIELFRSRLLSDARGEDKLRDLRQQRQRVKVFICFQLTCLQYNRCYRNIV